MWGNFPIWATAKSLASATTLGKFWAIRFFHLSGWFWKLFKAARARNRLVDRKFAAGHDFFHFPLSAQGNRQLRQHEQAGGRCHNQDAKTHPNHHRSKRAKPIHWPASARKKQAPAQGQAVPNFFGQVKLCLKKHFHHGAALQAPDQQNRGKSAGKQAGLDFDIGFFFRHNRCQGQ